MILSKISCLNMIVQNLIAITFVFFIDIAYCNNKYLKAPDPHKFKNPTELWERKPAADSCMLSLWYVFSDRDNLRLYKTYKGRQKVASIKYLHKFRVFDLKYHYLHVESCEDKSIKGWGRIEQFIILPHAVKTKNSITHKAVLINQLGSIDNNVNIVDPLRQPGNYGEKTNKQIKILEFAHIYNYFPNSKDPISILLGKAPYFFPRAKEGESSSIQDIMLGWVPADRILTWDTREGFEPNTDRKHPIYYFKDKKDMVSYYQDHIHDDQVPRKDLLVICPDTKDLIDRSSWPPKVFRYAILKSNNDITQPFEIGITSAKLNERILDSIVINSVETVRKNLHNRDVVFVIDATMSMKPYLKLAGKISKKIMDKFREKKRKNKEKGTLRFGVALYRDYNNLNNVFEIDPQHGFLTPNVEKTKKYLENIIPKSSYEKKGDPAYYPEAVFQGLIRSIKNMNWKDNSRKLIIHIGDAGNHSRGKDKYNEKDIADRLSSHDISYSAIQIENDSLDPDNIKAQCSFCNQTRLVIKNTLHNILALSKQYEGKKIFPYSRRELMNGIAETSLTEKLLEKKCIPCGNERWQLRCIKPDQTRLYEKTIETQINNLTQEVFEAKAIVDDFRRGLTPKPDTTSQSKDNVSYSPLLMPGIVKSLTKKIGEDMLIKSKDPAIKNKIIEYIGENNFNQLTNRVQREEMTLIIGEKELKRYLDKDVRFFTKAYVMLKKPGSNYSNKYNQLNKKVLFRKKELELLIYPLGVFKNKYLCQIHPNNLRVLWTSFLLAILGEDSTFVKADDFIKKDDTASRLYEQQFGVSLRKSHRLLNMKYSEVIHGKFHDEKAIEELEDYLCKAYTKLKKKYDDVNSYYTIFGNEYIWVDASVLP